MPSNKPEYASAYQKKWYAENKEAHKQACNARRDRQVVENQKRIVEYLRRHPCVDCGETDIVVLQFDHVRGKKFKEIGRMMACSWKTIEREIAKCVVRCANDHTRRTLKSQKSYKWSASVKVAQPPFKRTRQGA